MQPPNNRIAGDRTVSTPKLMLFGGLALMLAACQSGGSLMPDDTNSRLPVSAGPLKPYKEAKFEYRTPIEIRDGGDFAVVPYDELRDINKRDEMPVRKVRAGYTKALPDSRLHDFTYQSAGRTLQALAVGDFESRNRPLTVIYLYGRDGNREWGFDDERFGGNFNRLKNLVNAAGGLYISPDFTDFAEKGAADIAALVDRFAPQSGETILACGSMGAKICWALLNGYEGPGRIDGAIFLGGFPDSEFLNLADPDRPPVFFAQGSDDPVYSAAAMTDFYQALRARGQQVRMRVFQTGGHGTPVRMIDWRDALNWIVSR